MISMNRKIAGWLLVTLILGACALVTDEDTTVTITVISTNDVHGQLLDVDGNRGLAVFGGYTNNVRAARDKDGGALLLIDAGDMWQGTLESNLPEGEPMIAAYNALGYTAAAVGNHEFDFGPLGDKAMPESANDDAQGALKLRAVEAEFPLLAANLIDRSTGVAVDWPNVMPTTMIEAAGVKIGLIGVMSENALTATIAANVRNLTLAPLAPTIESHARALRNAGAEIVIVTAHAGSQCEQFDDPQDLSSCNQNGEIMQVARAIPVGLVDQIIGGHVHRGIAHEVNGIVVTSSFSNTRAFGRVDYTFNTVDRTIVDKHVHAPHPICAVGAIDETRCLTPVDGSTRPIDYEGAPVLADAEVQAIANAAEARANEVKLEPLGVYLETPITLDGGAKSALGNMFTQAMLESTDSDVVIHNVMGGLRANLPAGELIYNSTYQVYPFDNRVTYLRISGEELRRVVAHQASKSGRRAGVAGMRAVINCMNGEVSARMFRDDGSEIGDSDAVTVAASDFLVLGGDDIFTPIIPEEGLPLDTDTPLMRDVFVGWLRQKGGTMRASDFLAESQPRWEISGCDD